MSVIATPGYNWSLAIESGRDEPNCVAHPAVHKQ
jgi:hypothetical protein